MLQVYKDYYPPVRGGIENHLNLLSNGLKDRGVKVQVLVANTKNRFETETLNGIPIAKAPQWGRFYSAPLTPTFLNYLKRFGSKADIIHFQFPNPTADLSFLIANIKKKLIVTYQSDIVRQGKLAILYWPFMKLFLNSADRIIASSPNYINSSRVLSKLKHKCTVIPLGIDINRFCSMDDASLVASIRAKNGDIPIILFVGCLRYYKGLHILISAMKSVDARLLIIGSGPEGEKLRRMVDENDLSEKVTFLSELSDEVVNAYYKACDIFVLPSHLRSEAFGLVQLEAMACKKPVVSTELSTGTSFVNRHRKTGIVVRPNDPEALARALNLLLINPRIRIEYGENGFRRVSKIFSAEKMVEATKRLYRDVLDI